MVGHSGYRLLSWEFEFETSIQVNQFSSFVQRKSRKIESGEPSYLTGHKMDIIHAVGKRGVAARKACAGCIYVCMCRTWCVYLRIASDVCVDTRVYCIWCIWCLYASYRIVSGVWFVCHSCMFVCIVSDVWCNANCTSGLALVLWRANHGAMNLMQLLLLARVLRLEIARLANI